MTRFERMQIQRREAHQVAADASWFRLRAVLDEAGLEYTLFGSYAHGTFLEHSDIDLMVMGDLGEEIRSVVRRAASSLEAEMKVAYDLYFEQDLSPVARAALLEQ